MLKGREQGFEKRVMRLYLALLLVLLHLHVLNIGFLSHYPFLNPFAVVLNVMTHPPPVMLSMMAYSHSVILGVMTHLPPVMLSMMA